MGLAHCTLDLIPKTPNPTLLDIDISDGLEPPKLSVADVRIYTDGSKIEEPSKWGKGAALMMLYFGAVVHNTVWAKFSWTP
jgi:hypothetical protein